MPPANDTDILEMNIGYGFNVNRGMMLFLFFPWIDIEIRVPAVNFGFEAPVNAYPEDEEMKASLRLRRDHDSGIYVKIDYFGLGLHTTFQASGLGIDRPGLWEIITERPIRWITKGKEKNEPA